MSNKKQIRLRTIQASNWIDPKNVIIKQSLQLTQTQRSPKRQIGHLQIKMRTQTEPKSQGVSIKKVVLDNLREDRIVVSGKTNLQRFPKRESVVKNGNPYRYFLNSKKMLTEQSQPETEFRITMQRISRQNQSIYSHAIAYRRKSESCHCKLRLKTECPLKPVKSSRLPDLQGPEPWYLRDVNEQDFNFI